MAEDNYVVIADDFHPCFESEIEKLGIPARYILRIDPKIAEEGLISKLKETKAKVLAVRSNPKVPASVIEAVAPDKTLEAILRGGVGVDNIDKIVAKKYGIAVCNTPEANVISVAERVMAFMFNCSAELDFYDKTTKQGIWAKKTERYIGKKPKPTEIYGKTLGIYGLGNIGKGVASRAKANGMKILAYDPFVSKEVEEKLGVKLVSLEELAEESDYMTIHAPLTEETKNSVNKELLSKAKDNIVLINTSRGDIIGEDAIEYLLDTKPKSRVCLDVYKKEKEFEKNFEEGNYKFLEGKYHNGLKLSPHLGASTEEAEERVAQETAFTISELILHGRLKNAVNFMKIPEDVDQKYLDLADMAGYLCANISQLESGNKHLVAIEYTCYHDLYEHKDLFGNFIAKGVLGTRVPFISTVNAKQEADKQGIKIVAREPYEKKEYDAITADVISEEEGKIVKNSVRVKMEEDGPLVQRINNYNRVNIIPHGDKFLIEYDNKKGMIATVGSVGEKHNVNFGFMNIVENSDKSKSFAAFSTDKPLSEEAMREIRQGLEAKGIKVYLQKHVTFN